MRTIRLKKQLCTVKFEKVAEHSPAEPSPAAEASSPGQRPTIADVSGVHDTLGTVSAVGAVPAEQQEGVSV